MRSNTSNEERTTAREATGRRYQVLVWSKWRSMDKVDSTHSSYGLAWRRAKRVKGYVKDTSNGREKRTRGFEQRVGMGRGGGRGREQQSTEEPDDGPEDWEEAW